MNWSGLWYWLPTIIAAVVGILWLGIRYRRYRLYGEMRRETRKRQQDPPIARSDGKTGASAHPGPGAAPLGSAHPRPVGATPKASAIPSVKARRAKLDLSEHASDTTVGDTSDDIIAAVVQRARHLR